MATPITHIVLAQQAYKKRFFEKCPLQFYLGTSFPDIRYLGVIEREEVHLSKVRIKDLKKESDFMAGFKFHSWVDEVGAAYCEAASFAYCLSFSQYEPVHFNRALKFCADQLLYDRVDNWPQIIKYFDNILEEELKFGIKKKDIKKWHKMLQDYFSKKPDLKAMEELMKQTIAYEEFKGEIPLIKQLAQHPKIDRIILDLYTNFSSLV